MIDIFVIISLVIFYILFIGRTISLSRSGVKVIVLGKTKNTIDNLLENSTLPFLILWTILILLIVFNVEIPLIFDIIIKNTFLSDYLSYF